MSGGDNEGQYHNKGAPFGEERVEAIGTVPLPGGVRGCLHNAPPAFLPRGFEVVEL